MSTSSCQSNTGISTPPFLSSQPDPQPLPPTTLDSSATSSRVSSPPPLLPVMKEIAVEYNNIKTDTNFLAELADFRKQFTGQPLTTYECKNLSKRLGKATVYLKREDRNHTDSHKINHCVGEALLAKKMGKSKLIVKMEAGQHGVALGDGGLVDGNGM